MRKDTLPVIGFPIFWAVSLSIKPKLYNMNIYVSNLNYRTGDQELEQLFAEYGTVSSARIIKDRETGRSRGFGFVEMDSEEEG